MAVKRTPVRKRKTIKKKKVAAPSPATMMEEINATLQPDPQDTVTFTTTNIDPDVLKAREDLHNIVHWLYAPALEKQGQFTGHALTAMAYSACVDNMLALMMTEIGINRTQGVLLMAERRFKHQVEELLSRARQSAPAASTPIQDGASYPTAG